MYGVKVCNQCWLAVTPTTVYCGLYQLVLVTRRWVVAGAGDAARYWRSWACLPLPTVHRHTPAAASEVSSPDYARPSPAVKHLAS